MIINRVKIKAVCYCWLSFLSGCATSSADSDEAFNKSVAAEANVKLAIALLTHGYVKEAKQKLLVAQKIDPTDPAVWYGMGYFKEAIGEISGAKENYIRAITLDPRNGSAHNNYGTFLCRIGQYDASIEQFLLATKDPNYLDTAVAYENAGLCALKIPNRKLAKYFFQKALAQDSRQK